MKKMIKTMLSFAAVVSAVTFSVVSCGPEGPVGAGNGDGPDKGPTEEQLAYADSVETALYKQARAMQVVLTGESVQVSGCQATETEGLYEITLSTGASFVGYPGADENRKTVLSYVEEDGVKSWAAYDEQGLAAAFKDEDGASVALTATVDVSVEEGKIILELDERQYPLGYAMEDALQAFDFELLADAQGTVYAVEFIFGEGLSEVVYVSSYEGVYFYLPADEAKAKISEIYIKTDGTASVAVAVSENIEWTPQVAEGWNAHVRKEEGVFYVDITTGPQPTADQNEEVEGEDNLGPQLQIVSPEGDFVFSSISMVTEPFRSVFVSVTDAVVIPATGLGKFAYGISQFEDYDSEQVLANAAGLIAGTVQSGAGCGVSETSVRKPFADILGSSLDPEKRYVLWAVGDGALKEVEFGEIAVNIDVKNVALLDARIEVSINGAAAMMGGVTEKTEETMADILYQANNGIYDIRTIEQSYTYSGAASEFTMLQGAKNEMYPASSYVVWVIPAVEGEYTYTEGDVIYKEFTTNPVTAGGSLELTCSEATATPSSLSFDLSCEGASMIYYAFLNSKGNRFLEAPDYAKFEQIVMADSDIRMGDYKAVIGNKVTAVGSNLNDEAATEYWLYAVAVDADGKYGKVHCVSAMTLALAYDTSISLKVENLEVKSNEATVKVTSTGGDLSEYIYWMGRISDPFWANSIYCGSTPENAQKFMALNPEHENIVSAMRKYGRLAEDGTITFDGLTMETSYVFLILEKGEQYYSPVGYKLIKTLAADLGEIVREGSAEWNAAKNAVKLEWHKQKFDAPMGLMASYGFNFSCPDNLTAYVMVASDNYFTAAGITKMEHIMIAIENYAGAMASKNGTPLSPTGELMSEPDYYKNGTLVRASLMNVYEYYAHGNPMAGSVTYFAKGSHGKDECYGWENGHCTQYDECTAKIQRFQTLTPWEDRAEAFGLEGQEKAAWAQALLEAYESYYKDAKPHLYENDGKGIDMYQPYGSGPNDDGIVTDKVVVMFKDLQGNYYEPMYFEVPNYFEK